MAPVFAYLLTGLILGTWPGSAEILGSLIILAAIALALPGIHRSAILGHTQLI
jgi:drug/metabolite transporter (DMT)-like permease